MSATKLRKRPIAEQIAEYEREIKLIDEKIARGKKHKAELQRHIRILQRPEAEKKHQHRLSQYEYQKMLERKKQEALARTHAKMQREVEECLRMNGKIV